MNQKINKDVKSSSTDIECPFITLKTFQLFRLFDEQQVKDIAAETIVYI